MTIILRRFHKPDNTSVAACKRRCGSFLLLTLPLTFCFHMTAYAQSATQDQPSMQHPRAGDPRHKTRYPTAGPIVPIQVIADPAAHKVTITAGGQPFTEFIYPDTLEKPVLYPVYSPDGQLITRGFPLQPRAGEPVDHPHHIGIWFSYENVNGLDFWNNSYAIPAEKKHLYGWIRVDSVPEARAEGPLNGSIGRVQYAASWTDQQRNVLLKEHTILIFSAYGKERTIDRVTTLTAQRDIDFADAKDGLLGLRVTKELQIPSNLPGQFMDDKGNITKVAAGNSPDINGNYLTGEGRKGDSAWGTRAAWCMLYGKKGSDTLSIAIIDNPANPGYPTYWHARGYGLFAANPLGQSIFSNGKESLNLHLVKGQHVTFRYRIVIAADSNRLSTGRILQLADDFSGVGGEYPGSRLK
jgi:methane monooxygenase PmoA-like